MKKVGKFIILFALAGLFALIVCLQNNMVSVEILLIATIFDAVIIFGGIQLVDEATMRELIKKEREIEKKARRDETRRSNEKAYRNAQFFAELAKTVQTPNFTQEEGDITWEQNKAFDFDKLEE